MKNRSNIIDMLFVLSLFCVFAVTALLVVILGANVYKGISANMEDNYSARVSVSYITEKVRQNDTSDGVEIRETEGGPALVLKQSADGYDYETWIYAQDGHLKEATIEAGQDLSGLYGENIMEVSGLRFEMLSSGLIRVTVADKDNNQYESMVHIKSGTKGDKQ